MTSNKKILAVLLSVMVALAVCGSAYAANTGDASIGFSTGTIFYEPLGISGVEASLGLSFGQHTIDTGSPTQTYQSQNKAGYVVNNQSGGSSGYTVTLGLSAFDRGLEGASLTLYPDSQGLITDMPIAMNPPVLLGGMGSLRLEADGMSSAVILEGTSLSANPNHVALGRWGSNFMGDLTVYTNTIVAGNSKAVMTWELTIA